MRFRGQIVIVNQDRGRLNQKGLLKFPDWVTCVWLKLLKV